MLSGTGPEVQDTQASGLLVCLLVVAEQTLLRAWPSATLERGPWNGRLGRQKGGPGTSRRAPQKRWGRRGASEEPLLPALA